MPKRVTDHHGKPSWVIDSESDPHAMSAIAMASWVKSYQVKYRSSRMDEPMDHDAPDVHLGWATLRGVNELLLRSAYLGHRDGVVAALTYGASPTTPVHGILPINEAIVARDVAIIAEIIGACATYEQRLAVVLLLLRPGEPRRMPNIGDLTTACVCR